MAGEVPALLMVSLLVFMPRSPRRLLSLGREEQAEKALRWLRGEHYDTHIELHAIQVEAHNCCNLFTLRYYINFMHAGQIIADFFSAYKVCFSVQHSIDTQSRVTLSQLATPVFYRPIAISVTMRFLQQMTGITPILVYLEPIFSESNVSLEPKYDSLYVYKCSFCI